MDASTPRTPLIPHTHPDTTGHHKPPVVTQRHHTKHSRTQAECLLRAEARLAYSST
jgi:hypothetical protein